MKCLEFRRVCLAEPANRSADFIAHRGECAECRRFADGVSQLDNILFDAMQVPAPQDLATRIKLRQVIGKEEHKRRVRPWQFALAASLILSVAISGFFGYRLYTAEQYIDGLRLAVLEHIKQEPEFLAASSEVPQVKLRKVLASFGGELTQYVAPVMSAEICALKDTHQPVAHAVLKGEKGAVTLLYMNGRRIAKNVSIHDDRFHGILMPAGQGNLALVAEADEPLQLMMAKLKKSLQWKI